MERVTVLILLLVAIVGCVGCGGGGGVGPGGDTGLVALRVVLAVPTARMNTSAAVADIAAITVDISGPEMETMSVSLTWDADSAEARGHFDVPQGIDRLFEVRAVDADEEVLFAGQTISDVEAGATTSVTVDLWPVSADVEMEMGIANPSPGLGTLWGICYGPFRPGQSPRIGVYPSEEEVAEDLAILAGRVERIRLYSSTHIHREIPRLAADAGLRCWAQAWLDQDAASNEEEIEALIAVGQEGHAEVLIVGSEVLLRGDMSAPDLIALIERVRAAVPDVPVTYNDTCQELLDNPEVVTACDLVMFNSYPYWEAVPPGEAVAHVARDYDRIAAAFPDRRLVIGETGWPSAGADNGLAIPDPVHQRRFLTGLVEWARSRGVEYLFFSAFDEPWKAAIEGTVGGNWGLFNSDRSMKTEIRRVWY